VQAAYCSYFGKCWPIIAYLLELCAADGTIGTSGGVSAKCAERAPTSNSYRTRNEANVKNRMPVWWLALGQRQPSAAFIWKKTTEPERIPHVAVSVHQEQETNKCSGAHQAKEEREKEKTHVLSACRSRQLGKKHSADEIASETASMPGPHAA
jgi:hypothetical protein